MTESATDRGRMLAERLGVTIIGVEGHDLKVACVACQSSDAGRVHAETGVFFCYSCNKSLNAFDLSKVVLGDHKAAIDMMVDVGLFEPYMGTSDGNGRPKMDILEEIAKAKGVSPDAFRAFGAVVKGQGVRFPMYGPDGEISSWFTLTRDNGKGRYDSGKSVGLFFPGRLPNPGEAWCLVEGVKDAAALHALGFTAGGLPGNRLNPKFAPLFFGTEVTIVPDCDSAGEVGAQESARVLHPIAKRVRLAKLPMEFKQTKGPDVRDCLKHYGEQGPAVVRKAVADAVPVGPHGRPEEAPRFVRVLTSAELLALDLKPRFLIKGVMVAGAPAVLGGRSKAMKTSLAIDQVVSLGSGTPFLGRFPTERVNVAFWSGESGAATIRETALRIAQAKGLDLADCSIVWGFDLPKLSRQNHLDALAELIERNKIEVAVIDPLYLSLLEADSGGRSSDLFFMGAKLEPLSRLGTETGCTVETLHHFRKSGVPDEAEPAGLEELAQSGICEWARQWLLCQRRSPYQGDGRHELWLRIGGSAGHAGLWAVDIEEGLLDPDTMSGRKWEVEVKAVTDARAEAKREKESRKATETERREGDHRDRVLQTLRDLPDGATGRQLRTPTRLNQDNVDRALWTLQKEGRVEACEVKTAKGTFDGFCFVKR